jgi:outer membrane protein assembly factor BamD
MNTNRQYRASLMLATLLLATLLTGCGSKEEKPDNRISAVELYEQAKQAMRNGAYARAIGGYRLLQSRFPFGRYTEQAQLELAYCYHKNFEPDLAIATLDRFIKTYPTHPSIDYAFYLRGLTNFARDRGFFSRVLPGNFDDRDQTFAQDSFRSFDQLIRRFPDSVYADDTRERMLVLRAAMASHDVGVAEYYLRRGVSVAAANRAKYVIETYQESPQTPDALAVLVQAYQQLDLPELSDDTYRVLKLNYPDHPYVTGRQEKEGWFARLWPFD